MTTNDFSKNALRFAALFILLAGTAAEVAAQPTPARYVIKGVVYSAAALAPGEPFPRNPLSDKVLFDAPDDPTLLISALVQPPGRFYAVAPRNLVLLSVSDAVTGRQLNETLVQRGGKFTLDFSDQPSDVLTALPDRPVRDGRADILSPVPFFVPPVPARRIRFTVRDGLSRATLFESEPVTVFAGTNTRWVLVPGEPSEIDQVKGLTSGGTFAFTRVGKIEVKNITAGLATVKPGSQQMPVPEYEGAPFGGDLWLFGGFDPAFYPKKVNDEADDDAYCYQLLAGGQPLRERLVKIRYEVLPGRLLKGQLVELGPQTMWKQVSTCYRLTPIAATGRHGETIFYSYADLLGLWRTGDTSSPTPKKVEVKLWKAPSSAGASATQVTLNAPSLELKLHNEPIELGFKKIEAPAAASCDSSSVGSRVDLLHAGNRCSVAVVGKGDGKEMKVTFGVEHDYLRLWSLAIGSNGGRSAAAETGRYSIPSTERSLNAEAFEDDCAYTFSLAAWAKTTNGYGYIHRAADYKAYYVVGVKP